MELRVLQYFLAVAREQSISAAAESLHLTQPTLSTQLRAMEEELGKQLLIRGTTGSRRVLLTEEGMILRKRAEEILALVQRTEEEIMHDDEAVVGDVYIGAGETDIVRLLARAAREIQKQHPDIRYHISSGNAEHVLEQLDKGLIDFGLLFGRTDTQKYEALPLPGKDTWGVLMRRDAPLAEKASVAPGDLLEKPLILTDQPDDAQLLTRWLSPAGGAPHVVATYNLGLQRLAAGGRRPRLRALSGQADQHGREPPVLPPALPAARIRRKPRLEKVPGIFQGRPHFPELPARPALSARSAAVRHRAAMGRTVFIPAFPMPRRRTGCTAFCRTGRQNRKRFSGSQKGDPVFLQQKGARSAPCAPVIREKPRFPPALSYPS